MKEQDAHGKTLAVRNGVWTVMQMATIVVEPVPDPKPENRIPNLPETTFLIPYDFLHNKKPVKLDHNESYYC